MKMTTTAIMLSAVFGLQTAQAFDGNQAILEQMEAKQIVSVEMAERQTNYAVGVKNFLIHNLSCNFPYSTFILREDVNNGSYISQICAYTNYRWFLLATKQIPERHLLRFDRKDVEEWLRSSARKMESSKKSWVVVN